MNAPRYIAALLGPFAEEWNFPIGRSTLAHWRAQPRELLISAAAKISSELANPWVFAADERHFAEFADDADRAALLAMSREEACALLDWAYA